MSESRTPARKLFVEVLESRDVPSVEFPTGANVVDVAARYGAIPNDGVDDTAAVQRAVNDYMARDTVLYFRDGQYNFSAPIDYALAQRGERGLWLQGQSQAGTVFRWDDNLAVFNQVNADGTRKSVVALDTFNGNNGNAFGNYLHDFTVEIGASNPGAIGVQYQTNNYGSIRNVTIRSADPAKVGARGLDIIFNEPGPMLISNLTVDGFDQGVLAGPQTYSAVFDTLTLMNQREYGFGNYRLPVSIHNFTSMNSVPAYVSLSSFGWGNTVITNATFSGGDPTRYAVVNENDPTRQGTAGTVLLRNVTAGGYAGVIDDQVAGRQIPGPAVTEYVTQTPLTLVPGSPATGLNLPVEATPTLPADPVADWVSVADYGANPYDDRDDSDAIQRALDSGAKTVYFPNPVRFLSPSGQFEGGAYRVGKTLTVGGNVQRVAGLYSRIVVRAPLYGTDAPLFRVVDGNRDAVQIDGFTTATEGGNGGRWHAFGHDTTATLIVKDFLGSGYRNGVRGGKVFIEDMTGSDLRFSGQQVWLRQINPEETVDRPKIVNDGGDLWILGLKTEGRSTAVDTRNGGRTEVLGGNLYNVHFIPADYPAFTTTNGSLSFNIAETNFIYQGVHTTWVRDVRNGVTRDLTRQNAPINGARLAANIGLYTDRIVDTSAPGVPANLRRTAATTNSVTLSWDAAAEGESFVRAYRVYRDGVFIGATAGDVTTFTDRTRPDGASAVYTVLAENAAGLRGDLSSPLTAGTVTDTARPQVVLATATPYRGNELMVTFNEPLASAAAANFAVNNGVSVFGATLSADGKTVTLSTSWLTPGAQYTLTMTGLTDRATTPNPLTDGTAAAFSYRDTAGGTGLTGTYFPTNNFTGTPVTRLDPAIDFDWGNGSPGVPGIGADNFSVRWTGQIEAKYSETYTFIMTGDDGIRLTVNGRTVIDRGNYSPNEITGTITLEAGKRYDIEVTVFEFGGGAGARLWWQSARQAREIVPASQLFPAAQLQTTTVRTGFGRGADAGYQIIDGGVQAEYFANNSTSGTPVLTRIEGGVNTFWGDGGPGGGVPNDNFSVRYTGFVLPQFTEDYVFTAVADDRVRLWVNGQQVINRNFYTPDQTDSTPVRLTAGVPVEVRMEVEEDFGGANALLLWRSPSTVQNYVPFLRPTFQDTGTADTLTTYNRLDFSFFSEFIGLRFDLAGLDLANNRVVDATLASTLAGGVGDEIALLTVDGVNDDTPGADWAETGPDRRRWSTFPGNAGGNFAFGGPAGSTHLGYMVMDNTRFQTNAAGRDGLQFTSSDLTRFLQADTDGLVSLMVRRTMPNFFGNINIRTKEFQDGSFAPGLRLTLAPKTTAAPLGVDLLPGFDTGSSDADDRTARNNASPAQAMRFRVSGTAIGATVTLYADGVAFGSAVANGDTTEVLSFGDRRLLDGVRSITARQTFLGVESADSVALPLAIDTSTPTGTVAGISPNPRNSPVDTVTVTFGESVTGVDLSDFTLNGIALNMTGATLTGSGTTYTLGNLAGLTASEGGYTLTLVAGGSGIADLAGNLLADNSLSAWVVDLTPPRPTVAPVSPAVRNTPVTSIAITFTEAVNGFDLADITLSLNGTAVSLAGATLTGSGHSYTLGNLTGLTAAEGEYVLTLNPAGSGIADAAGNEMVDAAGTVWLTDTTAPTGEFADVTPDPRTTPVPSLALTFSEAITGLDLGDLLLTRNGVAVDLSGATLTGSGGTYTLSGLTAATTAPGTYVLSVRTAGTGIADAAGNPLAAPVSVDWTTAAAAGPRVASVRRLDPNPTNANEVRFEVTFTEAVTGVDASDFLLNVGGGLSGAHFESVDGEGAVYVVIAHTGEGSGSLRLDVIDDDTIVGATGAKLGGTGLGNGTFRRGETYTIDRNAPRVTGISSVTPNPRRTPVDSLTVTFSELLNVASLELSDLTLTRDAGANVIDGRVTVTQTGPRTFRIDGLTALTAASGRYVFTVNAAGVTDVAGNAGSNTLSRTWTRETPRVTAVERVNANPTNASTVTYRVTLSEAVTGIDAADFRLVASSGLSGTGITGVTAISGNQYLVTVSTGTGSGTLRLDFLAANSGVADLFGNAVTADYTRGQVYTIDRTPPTVRSIAGVGSTTTSAVPSLVVTFSEAINPATFTTANLFLRRNGVVIDVSGLTIVQLTPTTFRIDGLSLLTADAGVYEFGVNWAGTADPLGNTGTGSRLLRWTKTV